MTGSGLGQVLGQVLDRSRKDLRQVLDRMNRCIRKIRRRVIGIGAKRKKRRRICRQIVRYMLDIKGPISVGLADFLTMWIYDKNIHTEKNILYGLVREEKQ